MDNTAEPTLELLEVHGFLSHQQVAQLQASIRARANIAVCGSAVTLKRTLMRALAAYATFAVPGERIIVVSSSIEGYFHPDANVVALEFNEDHPFETVFRTAMRMAPDRLIVDEPMKGPATYEVLRAMTKTRGSVFTHNASGFLARARLKEGILQHPDGAAVADDLLTHSIDVIVDVKQRGHHPEQAVSIAIHHAADTAPAH